MRQERGRERHPCTADVAYEAAASVLLGLTFGLVMFDRNALNVLSPFVGKALKPP
jgi:hypothetical protein